MPTTLTMVNESGHESLSSPSIHRSQPATNHSKIWLSGLFVVRNCSNSKGWSGSLILIKTGHVPAEMMFKPKCEIKENNCVHQILYWHEKNASPASRQGRGIHQPPLPTHCGATAHAEVEFDISFLSKRVVGPAKAQVSCKKNSIQGHLTWLQMLGLSSKLLSRLQWEVGIWGAIIHFILRQLSRAD